MAYQYTSFDAGLLEKYDNKIARYKPTLLIYNKELETM